MKPGKVGNRCKFLQGVVLTQVRLYVIHHPVDPGNIFGTKVGTILHFIEILRKCKYIGRTYDVFPIALIFEGNASIISPQAGEGCH